MNNFNWRVWEYFGLVTDRKGGWNDGFIGGFHHLVYDLIVLVIVLVVFEHFTTLPIPLVAVTFSVIAVIVHFVMEVRQAKGMRNSPNPGQPYNYWEFWNWHIGRHQDYGVPAVGLWIVCRWLI